MVCAGTDELARSWFHPAWKPVRPIPTHLEALYRAPGAPSADGIRTRYSLAAFSQGGNL